MWAIEVKVTSTGLKKDTSGSEGHRTRHISLIWRATIDDNIMVEQMKLLKVTKQSENPMDDVPSRRDANDAMLKRNQCDIFSIPSKPKSTVKAIYTHVRGPSSRDSQSMLPW
jgi:hypothetical protein